MVEACVSGAGLPASRPEGRCWCPCCTAEAAAYLLERGRPAMALSLLRGLPGRIAEAVTGAYQLGRAEAAGDVIVQIMGDDASL